jgi:hypothetical protein
VCVNSNALVGVWVGVRVWVRSRVRVWVWGRVRGLYIVLGSGLGLVSGLFLGLRCNSGHEGSKCRYYFGIESYMSGCRPLKRDGT